mmetsp:Transcript_8262/g.21313  ORF Transcript_8262/g.21313 Transcript_8262/m.21313 type:complete len:195 (+) Transcript_8262:127-711(+)
MAATARMFGRGEGVGVGGQVGCGRAGAKAGGTGRARCLGQSPALGRRGKREIGKAPCLALAHRQAWGGAENRRNAFARGERIACSAGTVQKLNTEELEAAIANRDKPVVIDFFATWCGPCVMLAKVLDEVAEELGEDVSFLKVDTDEEVDLANYFKIQGLPTLMFIGKDKGGKVLRAEGLLPAQQIKDMIKEVS